MSVRIPLPDLLGPNFRVIQGVAMGVGRGRLAGSDLERPFWGVRALGSATSIRELAASYCPGCHLSRFSPM